MKSMSGPVWTCPDLSRPVQCRVNIGLALVVATTLASMSSPTGYTTPVHPYAVADLAFRGPELHFV